MGYTIHQIPSKPTPLFQERSFGFSPSSPTAGHPLKNPNPTPNSVFSFSYPRLAPHSMVPLSWRVPLWCYFEPSLFFLSTAAGPTFQAQKHPKTSSETVRRDLPNRNRNKRQDMKNGPTRKKAVAGAIKSCPHLPVALYFLEPVAPSCQYIR